MPLLSEIAKRKKIKYFICGLPKTAKILEIGCGSGWLRAYMKKNGWTAYVGLDIVPPADIIGDIKNWQELGLKPESFDIIIAFEVIEHVKCFQECFDLLRENGQLLLTSPVPHFDWLCRLLEVIGLNQKRTSKHECIYFKDIPLFEPVKIKTVGAMAQWGIFKKLKTIKNY